MSFSAVQALPAVRTCILLHPLASSKLLRPGARTRRERSAAYRSGAADRSRRCNTLTKALRLSCFNGGHTVRGPESPWRLARGVCSTPWPCDGLAMWRGDQRPGLRPGGPGTLARKSGPPFASALCTPPRKRLGIRRHFTLLVWARSTRAAARACRGPGAWRARSRDATAVTAVLPVTSVTGVTRLDSPRPPPRPPRQARRRGLGERRAPADSERKCPMAESHVPGRRSRAKTSDRLVGYCSQPPWRRRGPGPGSDRLARSRGGARSGGPLGPGAWKAGYPALALDTGRGMARGLPTRARLPGTPL